MRWPVAVPLCLLACTALEPAPATRRPNIVLIMTDDQGLGDFSHAGHGQLETPHLDRLAAESPKVARFYVSPVCSPTRASLLTGRYNYRTRVVDTWIGRSMMEPEEVTIAELLRDAGYATGIFGKWHLGDCYPMRPIDQGFDQALVHRGGGLAQPSEPPENERRYTNPILFENGRQVQTEGYCTDVYFDAALEFIDESVGAGRPFLAYVAPNAPHDPYHDVPQELYEKYAVRDLAPTLRGKSDKVDREARICAMIENIDQNVGRLLEHLESEGLEQDTIVVFLNDNGPVWGRYTAGLRGAKSSVYEGGIRAPLFVRWPGKLDSSTQVEPIAAHIDLLPTLLDLVDVTPPEDLSLDGMSLAPLLSGKKVMGWPARPIILQSHRGNEPIPEHHFAVVTDRWKLVRASGFGKTALDPEHPIELFDLSADPSESNDLVSVHPDRVDSLRRTYTKWFEDVSSTRADNYAPPRIVVGTSAEPVTVLTKQDRRSEQGEGWGNGGRWWLRTPEPTKVEMVLIFNEAVTVDRLGIELGDKRVERPIVVEGHRVPVGSLSLPEGDFTFRVDTGEQGTHQIELIATPD